MRRTYPLRRSARLERELANTRFEHILGSASQLSLIFIGCAAALLIVQSAQFILAPILLAVIIGLMCGPIADLMEHRGVRPALSAAAVVVVLVAVIAVAAFAFAVPVSALAARAPAIWERLQAEVANWKSLIDSIGAVQTQMQSIFGDGTALTVTVAGGGPITDIAFLAPGALAQIVVFFGGLYFFLAARHAIRIGVLSLCFSRKMRWRTAHVFRDVELRVSRYLLTITLVNLVLGSLVALVMWAVGMPSPLLFGALAFVLNYIPFIGQATMLVLTFLIALGTRDGLASALLPTAGYWGLSFLESQVVTPNLLGRTMTINPFLIFLSLTFWLWAWGPVGGLVAVPSLLVLHSVVTHIVPTRAALPAKVLHKLDAKAIELPTPAPAAAEVKPKPAPRKPAPAASP
ncbi:MAG: AI-2E family transporter [Devosia nanyangense]|uniref:AI-2E family transporter n=1 Tax=Devosia nanyangense TaxID=1228055 RepID=A0A933KX80_9HYPH|nr:AI-2E family transporter [Devosia nanyangense]